MAHRLVPIEDDRLYVVREDSAERGKPIQLGHIDQGANTFDLLRDHERKTVTLDLIHDPLPLVSVKAREVARTI